MCRLQVARNVNARQIIPRLSKRALRSASPTFLVETPSECSAKSFKDATNNVCASRIKRFNDPFSPRGQILQQRSTPLIEVILRQYLPRLPYAKSKLRKSHDPCRSEGVNDSLSQSYLCSTLFEIRLRVQDCRHGSQKCSSLGCLNRKDSCKSTHVHGHMAALKQSTHDRFLLSETRSVSLRSSLCIEAATLLGYP